MKTLALHVIVLLCLSFGGCRSKDPFGTAQLAPWRPPQTNPHQQIVATNTRFGLKLFHELLREQPDKNLIVSPLSVALALGMVYNGAATTTQTAIGKTLEVDGLPIEQVNQQYKALLATLQRARREVQLDIANSVWVTRGYPLLPSFLSLVRNTYGAEAQSTDIRAPGAARIVNDWVSKQTRGKITEIVSQEMLRDRAIVALLLDAAYFKGTWATQFDPSETQPGEFTTPNGQKREVHLMAQHGEYRYFETPEFQAISLPYASGRLSFYVFLPTPKSSLGKLCGSLTSENWQSWMSRFAPRKGVLNLPRLKLEDDLALDKALKQLGMTDAFAEGHADFSRMSVLGGVWLESVRHRTYLEVSEKGTEAAAVTLIPMKGGLPAASRNQFSMTVDHPFLCAIRDNETGVILFLGVIVDPGE